MVQDFIFFCDHTNESTLMIIMMQQVYGLKSLNIIVVVAVKKNIDLMMTLCMNILEILI